MVDDRHAEHARVLEHAAHQERGRHRTPVVGHRHAAGGVQLTDIGHLLAPRPARDGADRVHARESRLGRPAQDQLRDARLVVDRIRVRHAGDRGEAARHRGRTAGRHRLLVFLTRLPQMHVHVDQAGAHDPALWHLHHLRAVRGERRLDPRDAAILDQHVAGAGHAGRRVDDQASLNEHHRSFHPP